jgi:hypothetical protein
MKKVQIQGYALNGFRAIDSKSNTPIGGFLETIKPAL